MKGLAKVMKGGPSHIWENKQTKKFLNYNNLGSGWQFE